MLQLFKNKKPSKLQSSFTRLIILIWSTSNNVFQSKDTKSCDTYVGRTFHLNFLLNSKIDFVFRKLESSSFHIVAPTTVTDIAFWLVRVYFCRKSIFLRMLNKQFGSQTVNMLFKLTGSVLLKARYTTSHVFNFTKAPNF